MHAERHAKPQSRQAATAASNRTGVFATLANLLRGEGSSAPSTGQQGTGAPSRPPAVTAESPAARLTTTPPVLATKSRFERFRVAKAFAQDPTAADAKRSSRRFIQNPRSARRDHDLAPFASDRIADAVAVGLNAPPTTPSRRNAPRLHNLSRRAALTAVASVVVLLGAGASLTATPAQAASPWWHLTSGARPTYLQAGVGKPGKPGTDEQQKVTVQATGGKFVLANITKQEIEAGEFECENFEPKYTEQEFNATSAEVQAGLEGVCGYGPGNVEVSEEAGGTPEDHSYIVTFKGALAERPVRLINTEIEGEGGTGPLQGTVAVSVKTPAQLPTPPTADGEIYLTVENIGDAVAEGGKSPVKVLDTLPPGLHATEVTAGQSLADAINAQDPVPCTLVSVTKLSCEMSKALAPFDQIEVRIHVDVQPGAHSGEENEVRVSGGGAGPASLSRPIVISGEPVPFGVTEYELVNEEAGGAPATQAASHPFQQTTTITLNQLRDESSFSDVNHQPVVEPSGLAKDTSFRWPPGLLGNPAPFATCTAAQFDSTPPGLGEVNGCPQSSAVGVALVTVTSSATGTGNFAEPVFNLQAGFGEPARLGFLIPQAEAPVYIDPAIRSGDGEDYGLTVSSTNITQIAGLLGAKVTVWGVPGDPRHANSRGWGCLAATRGIALAGPCEASTPKPPAFLSLPTRCDGPMPTTLLGDSWSEPFPLAALPTLAGSTLPALEACNRVPFAPAIHSEPTSNAATSPTGLKFDINVEDEGLTSAEGLAQSQIKKAVVTLPQGFTTNPSVAEGLKACSEAQFAKETVNSGPGAGCPEESKVGSVEITSPLIAANSNNEVPKVTGSLFVAKQGENPYGNLLTIYLVARSPELGVLIKQALKVTPNPLTGQLTTEVDSIPQLPFSHFQLEFRTGQRAPLVTPPACGTYAVKAGLYPYSNPGVPLERESSFQINTGPEGQGCPSGGVPPFHPTLEAGTVNNAGGTYSPFVTHITRKDSEQEITRFSIKLPTGMLAKLKGVSECSDAQIAQAKSREVEGGGTVEQEHPSCPANSEIGHSTVGSGVGNVLAYAPGRLYFAGPYHGSPISIVSITAAKVGPFDLGTVVVRFALDVNHETAEVSVDGANSDPIPHIVDGIPIHLRDLRAYVDRPGFTLNPTSCAKKSTASTILGSGLDFTSSSDDVPVTVSSPFQAADCASLGFKPKLALNLVGKKTHRGALPAFKAVLTYPKYGAYANVAKAQVTLPKSEFLEQGHLKNVCTRKVFETGASPGENCPANSIYGKARAVTPLLDQPLEGPVYLRTGYGTKLPELAAALNGPQISITLAGKIDSVHKKGTEGSQIRNTFALVPDAPVEKFVLELKGGKKGLLVNSTDVCKGTHKALAAFTGQNGKLDEYEPALTAQCGKSSGKKKAGAKKKGKGAKSKGGK
jgi:hypothetical protein